MQPIPTLFRVSLAACACLAAALQSHAQPNAIPGTSLVPAVWYQSDQGVTLASGAASVWSDLSGNGNHATQGTAPNRPTLVNGVLPNGKPTLRFDGTDRLVFATPLLSQNWTCFAVGRPDWDNNQKAFLCGGTGSFEWRIKRSGDTFPGNQNVLKRAVVQVATGVTQLPTDSHSLLSARYAEMLPAAEISLRLNRSADGFNRISTVVFTNATTEVAGGEYFRGDIAAMVVFTNALNDAEVVSVENYLYNWAMKFAPSVISLR